MHFWSTEIRAIDPIDGQMKKWAGPNVEAPTRKLAEEWCQQNGLGYCRIKDILVAEIDMRTGKITDYEKPNLN